MQALQGDMDIVVMLIAFLKDREEQHFGHAVLNQQLRALQAMHLLNLPPLPVDLDPRNEGMLRRAPIKAVI